MKRFLPATLLMLGCALLFSCQQMHQKQDASAKKEATIEIPPPLHLGAVHQVFSNDKFALLRIIGPMPKEGTVLISHPADGSATRVGNLIVSSAQHARNNIIAADIRAGVVMKGDRVFLYRNITAAAEEEEEEQEPVTMTAENLDLGYTPQHIKDIAEKIKKAEGTEQEEMPEPEPEPEPIDTYEPAPAPTLPKESGLPKFDDIPDTISGWDSM